MERHPLWKEKIKHDETVYPWVSEKDPARCCQCFAPIRQETECSCYFSFARRAVKNSVSVESIQSFFHHIKHGDEEHQKWLKDEFEKFFKMEIK